MAPIEMLRWLVSLEPLLCNGRNLRSRTLLLSNVGLAVELVGRVLSLRFICVVLVSLIRILRFDCAFMSMVCRSSFVSSLCKVSSRFMVVVRLVVRSRQLLVRSGC